MSNRGSLVTKGMCSWVSRTDTAREEIFSLSPVGGSQVKFRQFHVGLGGSSCVAHSIGSGQLGSIEHCTNSQRIDISSQPWAGVKRQCVDGSAAVRLIALVTKTVTPWRIERHRRGSDACGEIDEQIRHAARGHYHSYDCGLRARMRRRVREDDTERACGGDSSIWNLFRRP